MMTEEGSQSRLINIAVCALYLKWQLIKTCSDETGSWPGTLIGLEADIMYGLHPGSRTNDD